MVIIGYKGLLLGSTLSKALKIMPIMAKTVIGAISVPGTRINH